MNLGQLIGERIYGPIEKVRPSALIEDPATAAKQAVILLRHAVDADAAQKAARLGMMDDDEDEPARAPQPLVARRKRVEKKMRGTLGNEIRMLITARWMTYRQICQALPHANERSISAMLSTMEGIERNRRLGPHLHYRVKL